MRVDEARPEYVRHVVDRMRRKDAEEFLPLTHAATVEEMGDQIVDTWGGAATGFSFHLDEPVAIGAMAEGRPNVVTLLFFATDRFPEIALPLARWTKRTLFPAYFRDGVHRIECVSIDGYTEAHKWIRLLGLSHEATFRGFGKGGETYHQFAMLREDVRSAGA